MENASKALLMAAGVLIGVLVMSLAVYIFIDFGTRSADINKQNAQSQLASYNSQFTSYASYYYSEKDANGNETGPIHWKTTIYDIITVRGIAIENNKEYIDQNNNIINNDELIQVFIDSNPQINLTSGNTNINRPINLDDEALIIKYRETNGELKKFRCNENNDIQYNSRGKVKSIIFHQT